MTAPRPRLRMRLALLYGGVFLTAGLTLLAATVMMMWTGESVQRVGGGYERHGSNLAQLLVYSGITLPIVFVLSAVLGWALAGRALRPLRAIVTDARDRSAGNLGERVGLDGRYDEFHELGAALDDLFARLEASFESQRHFIANASHELRTPLTAQRALIQVALADPDASPDDLRAACQDLLTLGEQQERLIEALLTLAGSERPIEQWEPFDLAAVAADVLRSRHAEADRRGLDIHATLAEAPASGDPDLALSLVANLIDNALRHNVPGGRVEVSTATAAGRTVVTVSNTGPVIPYGEIDRLFQPFQRLGPQRTDTGAGHGLGLAIVRAIAGAHGAVLGAAPRPAGGLDVRVAFPTRPAESRSAPVVREPYASRP